MATDRLQTQRFELKYLVSEETARAVRQFVRCYLKPDEFAATQPDNAYPVHSLYLDSPDLTTYHAVQTGEKNRFKLRIRYYSDTDQVVHFEIKRRTNDIISKFRASVHREFVNPLLAGAPPQLKHLAKANGKQLVALQEFCRLLHKLRATPRSHVAYLREAWMSPVNNSMRVTFDRAVQCEPQFASNLKTGLGDAVEPFQQQVVLELKFVDRMPDWCREMVRVFGLVRGGAPKYAQGVALLGEHSVSNRGIGLKIPMPAAPADRFPGRYVPARAAVAVA
ncbi:MAG: polyphosphate polymerase domain-containing protein [Verrucomicrobiota bacterium]